MPRMRTVKPEFWEDEVVASLSRDARLLFVATWNAADDEGLLRWSSAYLKATAFMYDDDLTVADVDRLMAEIVAAGLVFAYKGGKAKQSLAVIVKFLKHQRPNRPQASKLTPPSLQNPQVAYMYAARDGWLCHICNEEILHGTQVTANRTLHLSLDHVYPRSKGGSDYPSNIKAAHCGCNSGKKDRVIVAAEDEEPPPPPHDPFTESDSEYGTELFTVLNTAVVGVVEVREMEGNGRGEGELRATAPQPPTPSVNQRAQQLATTYTDQVPLSKFPAILGIAKKAIQSNRYADDEIRAALLRLAGEGRSVTVETLRIELDGQPPPRSGRPTGDDKVREGLSLAERLAAERNQPRPRQIGA